MKRMNSSNQIVFDLAKRTADTITEMFGKNCEVAVHDFFNLDESLIYLVGDITDRDIGSPATNLVLKELKKPSMDAKDITNYQTHSNNGIMLKSSTIFLRDNEHKIIGALCINYNLNDLMSIEGMLQNFLSFNNQEESSENFNTSVYDVINEMINQVSKKFSKPPASLSLEEKIEFTSQLDDKGVFLIKGSTEYVATIFGVSKFTIYNYLQKNNAQKQFLSNKEAD